MNRLTFCITTTFFCATVISAQWWPYLPETYGYTIALLAAGLSGSITICHRYLPCVKQWTIYKPVLAACLGTSIGYVWAASLGHSYLNWQQIDGEFQQDVIIEGRITQYTRSSGSDRLIINEVIFPENASFPTSYAVLLRYYKPQKVFQVGQRIRCHVRLKPARTQANPYGFDKQKWYVSQRIVKTGYVKGDKVWLLEPAFSLRSVLQAGLLKSKISGLKWMNALIFGDRSGFNRADWLRLQNTGTAHLFAISGLHIVIVAGFIAALTALLCSFCIFVFGKHRLPSFLPYQLVAIIVACGFYAYLANWQVAVTRAYAIVVLTIMLYYAGIRWSRTRIFLSVVVASILIHPFAVYGSALYLSCIAVGIILLFQWFVARRYQLTGWRLFVSLQVSLSLAMTPMTLAFFNQISVVSPLINLLLIPVMSMVVVPGVMLSFMLFTLMPEGAGLPLVLLELFGSGLEWMMLILDRVLDRVNETAYQPTDFSVFQKILITAILCVIFVLCLPAFRGRALLFVTLSSTLALQLTNGWLVSRHWQLHVLDVGQGNAMIVSKRGQAILIDTGAAFPSGGNFVNQVIEPFLTAKGLALTNVFISHFDNDHAGGLHAIKEMYPKARVITSQDQCNDGLKLRWQGLQIRGVWPPQRHAFDWSDNDLSCVLKIEDANHSVLFAGDIEKRAENALLSGVNDYSYSLSSTILIAPHHGSKTSSSQHFIDAISPMYVVYSQGWLNRWGFPHIKVRKRFQDAGVEEIQVSKNGYVRFDMEEVVTIRSFRNSQSSPWYQKTFSN